jgi:hypothetical protein
MPSQVLENQEPGPIPVDQIAPPVTPLAKLFPLATKLNADELLTNGFIDKGDFAEIDGKIEPTRDLALKLFAFSKLNYDTELLNTQALGNTIMIAVKARVYQNNRASKKVAEGLGGCTTEETARSGKRAYHDALARAETRAFKRALEAAVGLPFINQIIAKLFGGYEMPAGIAEERLLTALKSYIDKADNAEYLENWGQKNKPLADLLSKMGKDELRKHYAAKFESLSIREN